MDQYFRFNEILTKVRFGLANALSRFRAIAVTH